MLFSFLYPESGYKSAANFFLAFCIGHFFSSFLVKQDKLMKISDMIDKGDRDFSSTHHLRPTRPTGHVLLGPNLQSINPQNLTQHCLHSRANCSRCLSNKPRLRHPQCGVSTAEKRESRRTDCLSVNIGVLFLSPPETRDAARGASTRPFIIAFGGKTVRQCASETRSDDEVDLALGARVLRREGPKVAGPRFWEDRFRQHRE